MNGQETAVATTLAEALRALAGEAVDERLATGLARLDALAERMEIAIARIEGPAEREVEQQQPEVRLLGSKKAAAYLGVSYSTLWTMQNAGEVPVVRLRDGGDLLFDVQDLDRLIAARKIKAR